MDDGIVFNDYSEDEENADDDIDNVSILRMMYFYIFFLTKQCYIGKIFH